MDVEKMAQMMKMINSLSENETSDNYKLIKVMESTLPFSSEENKRKFNIMLKYMEINELINKHKPSEVGIQSEKSDWRKKVLLDIKGQLNGKKQNIVDFVLKFSELTEIMKNFGSEK